MSLVLPGAIVVADLLGGLVIGRFLLPRKATASDAATVERRKCCGTDLTAAVAKLEADIAKAKADDPQLAFAKSMVAAGKDAITQLAA